MMPAAPTCPAEVHDAQRAQLAASAPPDVLVHANCRACGTTLAVFIESAISLPGSIRRDNLKP